MCRLTLLERGHGENAREHALVITIQDTANTGKGSQAEDAKVLDQSASSTGAHEGLATMQRRIIDGGAAVGVRAHCEEVRQIEMGLSVSLLSRPMGDEIWVTRMRDDKETGDEGRRRGRRRRKGRLSTELCHIPECDPGEEEGQLRLYK